MVGLFGGLAGISVIPFIGGITGILVGAVIVVLALSYSVEFE